MTETTLEGIQALLAPIIILIAGMAVLLLDLRDRAKERRKSLPTVCYAAVASAIAASIPNLLGISAKLPAAGTQSAMAVFGGGMIRDGYGALLGVLLCVVAALVVGMSGRYLDDKKLPHGEFYALVLFATSGAMIMVQSLDLINLFVGLEVLSVSLYILAGYSRRELRSEEAAVKYFLLGAFASGFLLYGIALIYGAVGMAAKTLNLTPGIPSFTNLATISEVISLSDRTSTPLATAPIFVTGIALILVGLGFKASVVPFHAYAPDVYQGAPAPVSAFMSAAAKIGAFVALVRLLQPLLLAEEQGLIYRNVLWLLAFATILVGNVLAVRQTDLKRLMAYSSIAHAGYLLVGVLASCVGGRNPVAPTFAAEAVAFYLIAYALMNIGAFAVMVWLGSASGTGELSELSSFAGLARRQPVAAAVLTVLLLSLAGIPLTAGFLGKLYLFYGAVQSGLTGLAVAGLVTSLIGVFYYLNVIVQMYFKEPTTDANPEIRAGGAKWVAILAAIGTILLGILPSGMLGPSVAPAPVPMRAASR